MPDNDLLVSVVIPTRNGARRLPIVLDALLKQTLPRDRFEVLVADDGSTDDTADVADAHPLSRAVRAGRPLGQPGASNLGIRAASAPVIAFTDDDTVPAPDWLERGLEQLAATPSGLIAGHIQLVLEDPPTAAALLDLARGYLNQENYATEGFGATANLWARRDVLEELDCFDERFLRQGHDRDFGERALLAGHPIKYIPDVIVEHPARSRARDLGRVAYRLGLGFPELRNHSVGRLVDLTPPYRRPVYLRPWRTIRGIERVKARGYTPTLSQRVQMRAIQYFCLQLPLVAGSVKGEINERRRTAT